MSEEIYYGRECIKAANEMVLDYYMIKESICDDFCDLMRYGIKIIKTIYFMGGGKTVESKQINNVFYKETEADSFLKLIKRNKVTPVSLMDVVEDYIIDTMDEETA